LDRTNANLDNIAADENSLLQKIAELQAQVAAGSAATPEQMQELLDQASALVLRTRALADAVPDAPAPTPE
jgi:flagellar hook-associated protein FlgK